MAIGSGGILRALDKKKKAQSVNLVDVNPVIYPLPARAESRYSWPAVNVVA